MTDHNRTLKQTAFPYVLPSSVCCGPSERFDCWPFG